MKRRRQFESFSLSFLDVVCCGFGAIILLLVISKIAEPVVIEQLSEDLEARIIQLQKDLVETRGDTTILNRELIGKQEQLSLEREKIARLKGDLSAILGRYTATKDNAAVKNVIDGRLASARQNLTEEMKRLLGSGFRRSKTNNIIGGIPVDSEYIIFVIDTSGSMFQYSWALVLRKLSETLKIYPKVKGIQVMNDMGQYMFSQYRGRWIPDSPARRKAILARMRSWNAFSNSSPVEGITQAIRTFYAPDKKISIYVFGDEFTGGSIDAVVDEIDQINRADRVGNRRVRIHGVGFPVQFIRPEQEQITGIRFAILMRILAQKNGGTFVGLDKFTP